MNKDTYTFNEWCDCLVSFNLLKNNGLKNSGLQKKKKKKKRFFQFFLPHSSNFLVLLCSKCLLHLLAIKLVIYTFLDVKPMQWGRIQVRQKTVGCTVAAEEAVPSWQSWCNPFWRCCKSCWTQVRYCQGVSLVIQLRHLCSALPGLPSFWSSHNTDSRECWDTVSARWSKSTRFLKGIEEIKVLLKEVRLGNGNIIHTSILCHMQDGMQSGFVCMLI